LGVEHDYLEVFVSVGCISQEVCTPLHAGGCGGDLLPPPCGGARGLIPLARGSGGQQSLGWGFKGRAPEAKNKCKIAL